MREDYQQGEALSEEAPGAVNVAPKQIDKE
jgi:hypothetical protein